MALVKTNEEIEAGLNSLFKALPKELREQYRWLKPTVEHRLKKLDKLEREALTRRGLAGDNMGIELGISQEGRVEDEQASQKAQEGADKPGRKRQTAGKRVGAKDNVRKVQ